MPKGYAAHVDSRVSHIDPPVLTKTSVDKPTVFIGGKPAWRGIPAGAVQALQTAKDAADKEIAQAERVTAASTGPKRGEAELAEQAVKEAQAASMMSAVQAAASGGGDVHMCHVPLPLPPHGMGVVIDGAKSVLINGLPACRVGDTVLEALGPPNKIVAGAGRESVVIGD